MNEVKRNTMLNLLKGFACIGVVLIHITFPGMVGEIVKITSAYAVPVFFMIAGYYAFGKNEETVKRRLIKIVKIFIFAYFVFFVFKALLAFKNNELTEWLASSYSIKEIVKSVVFCTIDFAIPLWYLIAQIETYIFWYFAVKLKKENLIVRVLPVLFIIQVVLTTFCETNGLEWFWRVNFVTRSLTWFALGYYLHTVPEEKIKKLSDKKIIVCALVGLIIVLIPTVFGLKIKFTSVGYIPFATALFVMALKHGERSICKPLEYLGDKLSLWIYIFHVPTSMMLKLVLKTLFGVSTDNGVYLWIHPILTLFAVIIISYVFNLIITKISVKR